MGRRPPQRRRVKAYGLYFIAALNLTLIWIYGQGSEVDCASLGPTSC